MFTITSENKLCEQQIYYNWKNSSSWKNQAHTLHNSQKCEQITWVFLSRHCIKTYLFQLLHFSYISSSHLSMWFSTQIVVVTGETINLAKLVLFLHHTFSLFVLRGKEYLLPLTEGTEFASPYLKGNIVEGEIIYVWVPCVSYFLTTVD